MVSFLRASSAPPLFLFPAAAAAALVLCAFAPSPSSASKLPPPLLLGIAPEDEHYYSADVIPCRDGSGSFPRRRLNDGFCDCPDGTDEPGTPACPEARFYYRNIGDVPSLLYSSCVNDRICDCCDGSDESDGRSTCVNTCRKNQATSATTDPRPGRRQAWRWGVGVEMLGEDLADLRAGLAVEFMIVSSVSVTCFCYWCSRTGRRRYLFKS